MATLNNFTATLLQLLQMHFTSIAFQNVGQGSLHHGFP